MLSFFIDFLPAVRTKNHQSYQTEMQMAEEAGTVPTMRRNSNGDGAADSQQYFRGQPAPAGTTAAVPAAVGHGNADAFAGEPGQNFYPNANGFNNQYPKPAAPLPSRNF